MSTTKAITLRLKPADYESLEAEARRIGVSPGTLARVYVRAGLLADDGAEVERRRRVGLGAIQGLAALRARLSESGPVDIVELIRDGREELDQRTP